MLSEQIGIGYLSTEGYENVEGDANLQRFPVWYCGMLGLSCYIHTMEMNDLYELLRKDSGRITHHLDASRLEQPEAFPFPCLF